MDLGHTLVFGGTGMLGKATGWIAEHSTKTMIYGRNIHRLKKFEKQFNNVIPRVLDYQDTNKLEQEIRYAHKSNGPIMTVVAWIHGIAPQAIPTIKEQLGSLQNDRWILILVKGSSSNLSSIISSEKDLQSNCDVKEIQLGFKLAGSRSRWLTHEEISDGVIEGIKSGNKKTIVGTLQPWDKRP